MSDALSVEQLKRLDVLADIDERLLLELSPDIAIVEWQPGAILFQQGSYLDVAFWILEGQVDVLVEGSTGAAAPIFPARLTRVVGEDVTGGATARLSAESFDVPVGGSVRLGPGDALGEIGALNGWPQAMGAKTLGPCTLLQVRVPALRQLRRRSKALRARLDDLYRARTLKHHLTSTPLLHGCAPDIIEHLAERVTFSSLQPGDVVTRQGERASEFILVRSGFLKLSQQVGTAETVVSYVSKGDTLGEVELLVDGLDGYQVTATAAGYAELLRIEGNAFLEVVRRQPELQRRLWEKSMERVKELGFARTHLRRADLVDFALHKGLVQGSSVLVIDLDTCTRCDDCVRGCAATHGGIPRFVREGERYDGFLIARSCYHCEDPVCLIGCPTGAIRRANVGQVVEIDPALCIGCGLCSQNCPYDAIVMHDLEQVWPADALPERLRGEPRYQASKCDLCYTSAEGPACVSSCPHGCAHRVSTLEEFDVLTRARRVAAGEAV